MRAPIGTRIEEAGKIAVLVEQQIRDLLPGHVVGTLANCGLPVSGINQAYSNTGTVGSQDCDITISLDNQASPVDRYRRILRAGLTERFPGTDFSFLPGDITAKILNFGLPSPIDVQVSGRDLDTNFAYATKLAARLKQIAGIADVRIQQVMGQPTLLLASRRTFALGTGLTEVGHRRQRPRRPVGQRSGRTDLLARHVERHLASGQHPDTAEPAGQHQRPRNHSRSTRATAIRANVQPQLVGGLSTHHADGHAGAWSRTTRSCR